MSWVHDFRKHKRIVPFPADPGRLFGIYLFDRHLPLSPGKVIVDLGKIHFDVVEFLFDWHFLLCDFALLDLKLNLPDQHTVLIGNSLLPKSRWSFPQLFQFDSPLQRAIDLLFDSSVAHQEGQLDPGRVGALYVEVELVTLGCVDQHDGSALVEHSLQDDHLFGAVHLHDAVQVALAVVLEGLEVAGQQHSMEHQGYDHAFKPSQRRLLLWEGLDEGPVDCLVDHQVALTRLFLLLEEGQGQHVDPQSQLLVVDHSDAHVVCLSS